MTRSMFLMIVAVHFWIGSAASAAQGSEFTDEGAAAAATLLTKHFQDKPSGIVVGLIDGEGSKLVTAGTRDDGTGRPIDGETVFFIGSVTKTFTSLLLAEMASRGEVALDDPVAKYLPASVRVPMHGGKEITLMHLATNTAGFPVNPDNMAGSDVREEYESYSVEKMYDYLDRFQLDRNPGTEYEYSNLGMSLLGHALARKAGMNYETLVVERICKPLGMTSTRVVPTAEMKARLAMGRDEAGKPTGPWQLDAYAPAGAIHSTANDLLKYAAAQAGITRNALSPVIEETHIIRNEGAMGPPDGSGVDRFFGRTAMPWMDRTALQPPGMELLGHAGGAGSYHAWVGFDQKQHRGVVVLSAANDVLVEAVGWTLLQRLPLTADRLTDFAHDFVGIGIALELTPDEGELRITKVLPETPAEEAGLAAGEIIATIDDVATLGKDFTACVELLRGPAGTKVRLGILTPERSETRTVELTRRKFRT
jgi:D-alanyl-D-alanine-carboxypeptidase/D-alanyl-D-alanine-endopeptidase